MEPLAGPEYRHEHRVVLVPPMPLKLIGILLLDRIEAFLVCDWVRTVVLHYKRLELLKLPVSQCLVHVLVLEFFLCHPETSREEFVVSCSLNLRDLPRHRDALRNLLRGVNRICNRQDRP